MQQQCISIMGLPYYDLLPRFCPTFWYYLGRDAIRKDKGSLNLKP